MFTTVMTSKGQIVIPSKIRKRLNMKKGTKLFIEEKEDELVLKVLAPGYFRKIAGILETKGELSRALLEGRALDKEREAGS